MTLRRGRISFAEDQLLLIAWIVDQIDGTGGLAEEQSPPLRTYETPPGKEDRRTSTSEAFGAAHYQKRVFCCGKFDGAKS